ncbi:MAG TPA: glutamine--fructose-6-phosphate transaminase (isomerizing) [Clostridiales bacterium]|nr:MAG: glutamine--fructose-6-phosphate aminotransferase [Clostridiales bacterium GWD2_32_19]HCC07851.1 glutamine--fructose-6-phosphate transaminase (isomerizing) [Clostridiales bacterium]
MCGIIGYIGNRQSDNILLEGLKKLEYRGYDSAGVAVHNSNNIKIMKTNGRIKNLEERLLEKRPEGTLGIGHTRWATHGKPSEINSHPHSNKSGTIVAVHNGIIENYIELKERLKDLGYEFVSETDTEVIVHLLDYYYKGDIVDALISTLKELKGSYALAIICKDEPGKLIGVRKDSPLIAGIGVGENFLASDIPAILEYTRDIYLLNDNEIVIITSDAIEVIDINKNKIDKEVYKVTWDIVSAEKDGYEHFMSKEIAEQPKVVKDNLSLRLKVDAKTINLDGINLDKEALDKINKIYMVACGTAYHASLVGKYLIERLARIPVVADVASEFRYRDPIIDKNTLVIVISQSGETADTLAALRLAKEKGARTIGIVNVVGSTIARECDDILYTLAGPEIAVASTKAYSAQLIAMYLISCYIATQKGYISEEEFIMFRNSLLAISDNIKQILKGEDKIKEIANKYKTCDNVFYIGRGLDYLVAREGSLKLKEVAYIHSEAYEAGELKHGPIALIHDNTLVVGIATDEHLFEKTMSNLKEVKARGAKILAITLEGKEEIMDVADDVIYIPNTEWIFTSILANIPQQLIAYHMSILLGHDVDKPRNLAKSVTVE